MLLFEQQASIDIQGNTRLRMPKHFGYNNYRYAVIEQQRSSSVSEIVKPDLWQALQIQESFESLPVGSTDHLAYRLSLEILDHCHS